MLMLIRRLLKREPELKMVWEVGSKNSRLICAAHFLPYSFKNQSQAYVSRAEDIVFEGSIEVEEKFAEIFGGMEKNGAPEMLGDILDAATKDKIKSEFAYASSIDSIINMGEEIYSHARKLEPWAGYLFIWMNYLRRKGWTHSIEADALKIAREAGKRIHVLESFEEQLEALRSTQKERIAKRLSEIDSWESDLNKAANRYLNGDVFAIEREPIIGTREMLEKRDSRLYERMKPFIEKGNALIILGERHGPGVLRRMVNDGVRLKQLG